MSRRSAHGRGEAVGPSHRQLRAGELVRHALVDILREEPPHDEALQRAPVTVTEVRMSPDLKHGTCFVEPLGGVHAREVVEALNRHARYLRGRLGRHIEMKFTPDLRFIDEGLDEAARMQALFDRPEVRRDLTSPARGGGGREAPGGGESTEQEPPSSLAATLPPQAGGEK
jgi:ribosome-binding factor A